MISYRVGLAFRQCAQNAKMKSPPKIREDMDTIGEQKLWSFAPQANKAAATTCVEVRAAAGHKVISFMDLATKIAELQFLNREHVLLFRGQRSDHRNEVNLS